MESKLKPGLSLDRLLIKISSNIWNKHINRFINKLVVKKTKICLLLQEYLKVSFSISAYSLSNFSMVLSSILPSLKIKFTVIADFSELTRI